VRVSGERAGCLRRVMLGRGVSCNNCGSSGVLIIKGARWPATGLPALEVAWSCANCGAGVTTPVSLEEVRRRGFDDPDWGISQKAVYSPGPMPVYVP
jgi:hypothetical protein